MQPILSICKVQPCKTHSCRHIACAVLLIILTGTLQSVQYPTYLPTGAL